MNAIVIYSSQTGRTKQIAQAIASGLPKDTPCVSVDDMPEDLTQYDLVFVGFWIEKNDTDEKGKAALEKICHPRVAIFATLYDDPYSDDASKRLRNAVELLKHGSGVVGTYVTWTDHAYYMEPPEDNADYLHLDQAKNFAETTFARLANS